MKTAIFLCLASASLTAAALATDVTFVSHVDGVRYASKTTTEELQKTGGDEAVEVAKNHTYSSEPAGTLTLLEAAQKADKIATQILGGAYTGKNPRWVLKSAQRADKGDHGGYYYRFSWSTREGAYSNEKHFGKHGNLQIIVLLDGKVLPVEKIGPDDAPAK